MNLANANPRRSRGRGYASEPTNAAGKKGLPRQPGGRGYPRAAGGACKYFLHVVMFKGEKGWECPCLGLLHENEALVDVTEVSLWILQVLNPDEHIVYLPVTG